MSLAPGEILTFQRCNESTGVSPKGCGRSIFFRKTRSGATMPLDPVPSEKGNIALVGEPDKEIAEVVAKDSLDAYKGYLYLSHFATCPEGEAFRKANRVPPKPPLSKAEKEREFQITAHVGRLVNDARRLKLDEEGVADLFAERHPKMWQDEPNRAIRLQSIKRVAELARQQLGFPPRESAA